MIAPPRRSVTRFFIPLIDVFILLFCIFLLMPYVRPGDGDGDAPVPLAAAPPTDAAEAGRLIDELRADNDRLRRRTEDLLKQLSIRTLEIDRDTGRLFYYDPDRVEVAHQADAVHLIERERRAAGGRDVYFLIQFPREPSGYPEQRQVTAYARWFQDVPHGFDNPRGRQ